MANSNLLALQVQNTGPDIGKTLATMSQMDMSAAHADLYRAQLQQAQQKANGLAQVRALAAAGDDAGAVRTYAGFDPDNAKTLQGVYQTAKQIKAQDEFGKTGDPTAVRAFPDLYKTVADTLSTADKNTRENTLFKLDLGGRAANIYLNNKTPEGWNAALDFAAKNGLVKPEEAAQLQGKPNDLIASRLAAGAQAAKEWMDSSGQVAGNKAKAEADVANSRTKPLPDGALKQQNESLETLGTVNNINADMGALIQQLDSGALELGPINNAISSARNWMGKSNEQSRNFRSLNTTLERLRNDSLRLNSGVQTEGDAQRAWNELLGGNLNDKELVKQRLVEIQGINERGANLKKQTVENIRSNYNQGPLDYSRYEGRAAVGQRGATGDFSTPQQAAPAAPKAAGQRASAPTPSEGMKIINDNTGERLVFKGGRWVADQ